MRRGFVHVLAWLLATGAAVTLSWWGVHTVMSGTAYDPPRALPIAAGDATAQDSELGTATASPAPSPSTEKPARNRASTPPPSSPSAPPPSPSSSSPAAEKPAPAAAPAASGQVEGYDTEGGRVVFSLAGTYATLVSATPAAGWSMQVWKTETWIRVEFVSGADRVSVFCTWHDTAPRVEINDY
ncbi:hypothetical protein [Streptomyces poonensis]